METLGHPDRDFGLRGRGTSGDGSESKTVASAISSDKPVLLYAGSCPKCRFLSRLVVLLSLNQIKRSALEKPEWQKFYYEDYPEAKGFPVLFLGGRPIFGRRVFLAVPVAVARGWFRALRGMWHRLLRK